MATTNSSKQSRILSELNKLSHSLLTIEESPDIRRLLQRIADSAKEILNADLVEFYEYYQDENQYELPQVAAGERLVKNVPKVEIFADDAIWQLIKQTEPLYTEDAQKKTLLTKGHSIDRPDMPDARFVIREKIKSSAAIPLRAGDESMGLMFANYRSPQKFTDEQRELIELFASQAAIAIKNARLFQRQRDQAQAFAELNTLSQSLISFEDSPVIGKLLQRIADSAKEVLNADLVEFYEYHQDKNRYELPQIASGERLVKDVPKVEIFEDDAIWQLIHQTEPSYMQDAQKKELLTKDYSYRPDMPDARFVVREKIESSAAIPLRTGDESMGLMFANYRSPQKFTAEQKELIELFASQAAIAIKNARLFHRQLEQAEAFAALNTLSQSLISFEESPDIRKLLQRIADSAKEVLNADLVEIYEYHQDENRYELPQIAAGERKVKDVPKVKIYEDDAIWQLIHQKEPSYTQDAQKMRMLTKEHSVDRIDMPDARFVVREKIKSSAAIPLRAGNESMGLMFANYRSSQEFTEEQQELIELFASQAAIAIKNARLYFYVNQKREALVEIGQRLSSEIRRREKDVLELIYELASKKLKLENLSIALYDDSADKVEFVLAAVGNRRIDVETEEGWEPRFAGKGKTEKIIHTKKYLLLPTKLDLAAWGFSEKPGHKDSKGKLADCWLGVPMLLGDKVLGVIATYHYGHEHHYNKDDIEVLQTLANQAAIAIDNARLYYNTNRKIHFISRKQKALVRFSSQLSSKALKGENEVLKFIHDEADRFMDTKNMYIALYDEKENNISFPLAYKDGNKASFKSRPLNKMKRGRTEEILLTGNSILILTKEDSLRWYAQPERAEFIDDPLASWIGVPMKLRDKIIGVIATYHPTENFEYGEEDLEILQAMADTAAIAIENAHLIEDEKWAYLGKTAGSLAHRIGNKGGLIRLSVSDLTDYLEQKNLIDNKVKYELDTIKRSNQYLLKLSDYLFKPQKATKEGVEKTDVKLYLKDALRYVEKPSDVRVREPDFKADLPNVLGNKYLVEVFVELIVNAFDALTSSEMQEKELDISINQNDNHVEVKFEDNGPGLPPNSEKVIFELFSSMSEKKLSQDGHHGFGLWWVNTFLKDIGGKLRYEGAPGKGAIFIVELPLAEEQV